MRDTRNWGRWVTASLIAFAIGLAALIVGGAQKSEHDRGPF